MSQQTEHLSGGLVTARDPSLLAPGELQQTDDLFYKPSSPSLHKAPGRVRFNATALGAAKGLAFCGFDSTPNQLVALAGTKLYRADAGDTGIFFTLATSVTGDRLEAIHYNNRHVLITGGANNVLLPDGTLRQHGMQPVTTTPGTALSTGGTWPLIGQFGWYEYWTTEVYKVGSEDVESTFTGTPSQQHITVAGNKVTISRPTSFANPTATHWRVYRSIPKSSPSDVGFPNGFLIGECPATTGEFVDGGGTVTGPNLATTGDNNVTVTNWTPGVGYTQGAGNWTSPTSVTADDAVNATSGPAFWNPNGAGENDRSAMRAGGFGLGSVGNPITDIAVTVEAKYNVAGTVMEISLSWDGGANWTAPQSIGLTNSITAITVNGTWGRTWNSAEFADGIFFVRLVAAQTIKLTTGTIDVDYVKVQVTHGGTTGSLANPFRDIQISLGGVATRIGAAGPPTIANTGDIFQDSLVINDISNPTQVHYSMPGDIDAFPAVYLLKMDTKDKDSVTNIKSLGSVCLVGLASQVWRVNYLPREEDAEFDRGRCIEVVDTDHGMAGTHAACKFTLNGQTMVGYVSSSGPRMTNGFQAYTMTDDLDWESLVDISRLSNCILVNDARYHQLRLYYPPRGSADLSRCLFLSYHPSHLKDGKLKISGPAHVTLVAATNGVSNSVEKVVYTISAGGTVYAENRGSVDASGAGVAPVLKTREMYLAGPGGEWELHQTFVHHQSTGGGTYDINYEVAKANTDIRSSSIKPFTLIRRGLSNISALESGEGISIKIAGTDDGLPASFDYLVLEGQNMGTSDALTR